MRFLLVLTAVLTLTGCAVPPRAILRDPVSGQTVDCTYMSEVNTPAASFPVYGSAGRAIGAGMADGVVSAFREQGCINSYVQAGFRPLVAPGPATDAINVRSSTCGTSKGCGSR